MIGRLALLLLFIVLRDLLPGTSHPATESMVAALKGTEYDTGLDIKALSEIRDFFTPAS